MFSLFSFFKKKKRTKTPDEALDYTVAEDALETLAGGSTNIEPVKCAPILNLPYSPSQRETVTTRLLQGASESKSSKRETKFHSQSLKKSSSTEVKFSVSNVTPPNQEHVSVPRYHVASSSRAEQSLSTAAVRLYPDLKTVGTKTCSPNVQNDPWTLVENKQTDLSHQDFTEAEDRRSRRLKTSEVKVLKSIHDIVGEIKFEIQPRVVFSSELKKNFEQLKSKTVKDVTMIMSMITNSSMLDYDFDKELKVQSEYSHVTKYVKLQSFKDVQKHLEELKKSIKGQRKGLAFPSYFEKLRCYKGKKSDIVDCD